MRKIIFIVAVLLSSASSRSQTGILAKLTENDWNVAISGGTFTAPTTSTTPVSTYLTKKYGWLICYGMNTYYGHFWQENATAPPPASTFNTPNVNVQRWADTAAANGVQYAALTVMNEYGFMLWPSEVAYNMPRISLSSGYSPYYTDPYCVQAGVADTSIVTKFVNTFSAKGIEPILYVAVVWNQNLRQVSGGNLWTSVAADRQELFIQYYCKLVQELARKYPRVKNFWLDYAGVMPQSCCQRIYDAIKAINPNIVVAGNAMGESDFAHFPYDIGSIEEFYALNNPSYTASNNLSFGGTTYYIGKEVVGTPYGTYSQWYYYDNLCPVQPTVNPRGTPSGYVKMYPYDVATYQSLVDNAKTYSRPFLAAMLVDRNGNLVQENLDYLRQINFY